MISNLEEVINRLINKYKSELSDQNANIKWINAFEEQIHNYTIYTKDVFI
jgi:hypothetical protein